MSSFKIGSLIVCMLIGVLCLAAGETPSRPASQLISGNLAEREKAAEEIRDRRSQVINELIVLAGQKAERLHPEDPQSAYPRHDPKHLSILLLGDLRAVEAVPVLIENIEYRNLRTPWISQWDIGGLYPAAEALSKIGIPALEPTIEKLSGYEKGSPGHMSCCWVVLQILGQRLGKIRLEMAIEETTDSRAKENLTSALWYFQTSQERAAEEYARRKEQDKPDSQK
jgi:hypothetical protein